VTTVVLSSGSDDTEQFGSNLTVAEIAASMRVSNMTVYRLMQSGAVESVRFGRSYRVSKAAVPRHLTGGNSAH
jgi:excisionase family DNA binding protein